MQDDDLIRVDRCVFRDRRPPCVAMECAENHWRSSEARRVHVKSEQRIDTSQAGWRTFHRVIGRGKTVHILVPRRRTREENLNHDTCQIHVAEGKPEDGQSRGWSENENDCGHNERTTEMAESIRKPCQQIQRIALAAQCWQPSEVDLSILMSNCKTPSCTASSPYNLSSAAWVPKLTNVL